MTVIWLGIGLPTSNTGGATSLSHHYITIRLSNGERPCRQPEESEESEEPEEEDIDGPGRQASCLRSAGNLKGEFRTLICLAQVQSSAQRLGQSLSPGQPESVASYGKAVGWNALKILFKYSLVVRFGNAGAIVTD